MEKVITIATTKETNNVNIFCVFCEWKKNKTTAASRCLKRIISDGYEIVVVVSFITA